jgi:hypothetical protein
MAELSNGMLPVLSALKSKKNMQKTSNSYSRRTVVVQVASVAPDERKTNSQNTKTQMREIQRMPREHGATELVFVNSVW